MARERQLKIQILGDSRSAEEAFSSIEVSAEGMGSKIGAVGKAAGVALLGIGTAAAGVGILGVKTFASFEKAMNQVAAVSGATGDEFDALSNQAKELGRTTQFTASQAADAMGFLAMAGFDANEIYGAMPGTLQLAAAAQMDLGKTADIVTNILTGYGMEVSELAHANDVLVKAMTSANVDLHMLGEAMKYAGPVASAAGVSFEETAAAIALMGNAGIQGSMAGTSLRGALSRILNPTNQVTEAMQKYGLELTDAEGNVKSMVEIVGELEEANVSAGDMLTIFGQRAGPAMAALVDQGTDALGNLIDELNDSAGTAERVAAVQMQGLAGAWLALRSAMEGILITIGERLAPALQALAQVVLDNMPAVQSIVSSVMDTLGDGALRVAGLFQEHLLPVIERLLGAFQDGGFSGLLSEIPSLLADMGSAILDGFLGLDWAGMGATAVGLLVDGLQAVGSFVADIATWLWDSFKSVNWTGIGETMVSGLVDGVKKVGSFASDIAGWITDTFSSISWTGVGGSVVDGLLTGIGAVTDAGARILGWLSDQLTSVDWSGLGETVVTGLMDGITAIRDAGERVLGWLSEQLSSVDWSGLGTAVVDGLMGGIEAATDFGQRFLAWFQSGIQDGDWGAIGDTISGQISGALEGLSDIGAVQSLVDLFNDNLLPVLQTLGDEIGGRVGPMIDTFRESLGQVASNISANLGPTLENLRGLWESLQPAIGAILPVLEVLGTIVGGVLIAAFNGFLGIMAGVLPNAINAAFSVINGLITIITGLVEAVTGVVTVVKGLLTGDWALAWDGAKQVVSGMVTAITGLFQGLWGAIKGFVMAVVDGVIGLFKGLYHTLVGGSIVPDMINGIIEWFLKLPGLVLGIVSGFVSSAIGFFADLAVEGAAKAGEMIGGVIGAAGRLMSEAITHVSSFVHSALGFLGDLVTDGVAKAGELLTGILDKLLSLFIDGPKRIYDFVTAGVEELAKLVTKGLEKGGEFVSQLLSKIGELITDAPAKIYEMAEGIATEMGNLIGKAKQWGIDFINGLIGGLEEKLGALKDVAGNITGAITDGLGKLPGLSPSPLGIEIGQQFGDGLVVGFEDSMPKVELSAAELASAVVEGVRRDVSRLPELLEDTGVAFALEIDKMRVAAEEALILARLRGDSEEEIAKLQEDLELINSIIEAWVADTGNTIDDAYRFKFDQDERQRHEEELAKQHQATLDSYERLLNDLDSIVSGDKAKSLQAEWERLFSLKELAAEQGLDELVAKYEAAMKKVESDLEMVGQIAGSAVAQGMAAELEPQVEKMSKAAIEKLKVNLAAAPDLAKGFVSDLVEKIKDGAIDFEDAIEILAVIPREILEPELHRLSDTYREQLMRALIDGTDDALPGLEALREILLEVSSAMDTGAKAAVAYSDKMKQLPDGSWINTGGASGSSGSTGGGGSSQIANVARVVEPGENHGYSFDHRTGMWTGPNGQTWKSQGWEMAQQQTIEINNTLNVDGEPVAQAVNKVNTRNLTTEMGPI